MHPYLKIHFNVHNNNFRGEYKKWKKQVLKCKNKEQENGKKHNMISS